MKKLFSCLLFLFFTNSSALRAEYLGIPVAQARSFLQKQLKGSIPKQTGLRVRWTEHLIALLHLERLVGNEKEAKRLFALCDAFCSDLLLQKEWKVLLLWGCAGPLLESPPPFCSKHFPHTR